MYQERRKALFELLPNYSITVLLAGKAPYSIGDEKYPFKVNRSFYYLTGLNNEGLALMIVKMDERMDEILFIEPYDERMAKWVGGRIKGQQAREISGVQDVRNVESLKDTIGSYLNSYGKCASFVLCGDTTKQEIDQPNDTVDLFNEIRAKQPDVEVLNIFADLADLRSVKDEKEIAMMKKAIAITNSGIQTMMNYSREGIWENELEATFDYVLKCCQAGHAFDTILASGKNATILHYSKNNAQSKPNDLILCDLGASWQLYCADISRTFPANGKFTERQKQIYDIVLRANKMVMEKAKPGVTTRDLNQYVLDFYGEELKAIGLLENGKSVSDYYWHGVSHSLGLDSHDVSYPDMELKPGFVVTDEPGLYLEEEGIGIRIEDDLLITEDGCICLSADIIKEIDDIEAFMKK